MRLCKSRLRVDIEFETIDKLYKKRDFDNRQDNHNPLIYPATDVIIVSLQSLNRLIRNLKKNGKKLIDHHKLPKLNPHSY